MALTPQTAQRIRQLIQIVKSGTAQPQEKQSASQTISQLMQDPTTRMEIFPLLLEAGMTYVNGSIVPATSVGATGQPMTNTGPGGQASAIGPIGPTVPIQGPPNPSKPDYRQTRRAGEASKGVDPNYISGGPWNPNSPENKAILDSLGPDSQGNYYGNTGYMTGGADNLGGSPGQPGSVQTEHPEWANTFFGNVQPGALDALASDPGSAWALFNARGGPNGGSLANSTASMYGQNDFESAMKLASVLGTGLTGPGDTLNFANSWMGNAMNGQGTYADPGKILEQGLAAASKAPDEYSQRTIIMNTLSALEPYVDPTQYKMLQARVDKVMNDYLAYGLENGQQDLSGVLLNQIYGAVGGR